MAMMGFSCFIVPNLSLSPRWCNLPVRPDVEKSYLENLTPQQCLLVTRLAYPENNRVEIVDGDRFNKVKIRGMPADIEFDCRGLFVAGNHERGLVLMAHGKEIAEPFPALLSNEIFHDRDIEPFPDEALFSIFIPCASESEKIAGLEKVHDEFPVYFVPIHDQYRISHAFSLEKPGS
jgi:hypothetical protein